VGENIEGKMGKVLVIGLDAACLDTLLPWISKGELPCLEKLLGSGVYTELQSVIPPWTAPAWTSLITGKNPGKHGVFDFFKPEGNHQMELVSLLDNRAKAIWDYLSEAGKSSIVINVPITHPAKKINGILIPGYLAPEPPICYPPHILEEVKQAVGEYKIYSKYEIRQVSSKKRLQGYVDVTELRKDATIYLAKKYEWDFLMVQFQKTDAVFHTFTNEKHILTFFKFIDQCIGELVEVLGKNANIFLVSDHGMGKHDYAFYINSWLRKEGYLKTRGVGGYKSNLYLEKKRLIGGEEVLPARHHLFDRLMDYLAKMGISGERVSSWLSSSHMEFLRYMVPLSLEARVPRVEIDEENSLAYCPSATSLGIKINPRRSDEYQGLSNELIGRLKSIKDPEGNAVFESVLPREEYYRGAYINKAPDILFIPREMNYTISDSVFDKYFAPFGRYNHKMNGLFSGAGDDIVNSRYLGTVFSIFDVAPTILHIMGLPVPDDMDGRVLTEILREGSEPARRKVKYRQVDAERERIKDRVRRLRKSSRL